MKKSILYNTAVTAAVLFSMPTQAMDENLIKQQQVNSTENPSRREILLRLIQLLPDFTDAVDEKFLTPEVTTNERLSANWENAKSGKKILMYAQEDDDYHHIDNLLEMAKESDINLKLKLCGEVCSNPLDLSKILKAICNKNAIFNASPIEELDLSNNKEGWRFVNPIGVAIHTGYLGNLKTLNLGSSEIGDQEAECISRWLRNGRLTNLKTLELEHNHITLAGVASFTFIEGKDVPQLTYLGLSDNRLGGRLGGHPSFITELQLIPTILNNIPTITAIDLSSTGIDRAYLDDLQNLYIDRVKVHKEVSECTIS